MPPLRPTDHPRHHLRRTRQPLTPPHWRWSTGHVHPGELTVTNWPEVAETLVRRVRREALGGVADEHTRAIIAEILAYPDVPQPPVTPDETPLLPIVPVRFARDSWRFAYFSTVTTLGTAQDITLQELRIECFHPADEATRHAAGALHRHG